MIECDGCGRLTPAEMIDHLGLCPDCVEDPFITEDVDEYVALEVEEDWDHQW